MGKTTKRPVSGISPRICQDRPREWAVFSAVQLLVREWAPTLGGASPSCSLF